MSQAALVSLKGNKGVGGGGINGVGEGVSMRSLSAGLSQGGGKKERDVIPLWREIIGQSVQRNPARRRGTFRKQRDRRRRGARSSKAGSIKGSFKNAFIYRNAWKWWFGAASS